jgi:hypothetical protein
MWNPCGWRKAGDARSDDNLVTLLDKLTVPAAAFPFVASRVATAAQAERDRCATGGGRERDDSRCAAHESPSSLRASPGVLRQSSAGPIIISDACRGGQIGDGDRLRTGQAG